MKILIALALVSFQVHAIEKSICGPTDERELSFDPKIGRALQDLKDPAGCTVTMIGKQCAISAGHCFANVNFVEFNTEVSKQGHIQHPKREDIYTLDKNSLRYRNDGMGQDWSVFKLNANIRTGKLPGEEQGFYPVFFGELELNAWIEITGYGEDRIDLVKNFAQQTSKGEVVAINNFPGNPNLVSHNIDTMGGNSGSTIRLVNTGEIVGIHTHGGCHIGQNNSGTTIANNPELIAAIKQCLSEESTDSN